MITLSTTHKSLRHHTLAIRALLVRQTNITLLMLLLGCGLGALLCLDYSLPAASEASKRDPTSLHSAPFRVTALVSSYSDISIAIQTWHHDLQGAGRQLPQRAE